MNDWQRESRRIKDSERSDRVFVHLAMPTAYLLAGLLTCALFMSGINSWMIASVIKNSAAAIASQCVGQP